MSTISDIECNMFSLKSYSILIEFVLYVLPYLRKLKRNSIAWIGRYSLENYIKEVD